MQIQEIALSYLETDVEFEVGVPDGVSFEVPDIEQLEEEGLGEFFHESEWIGEVDIDEADEVLEIDRALTELIDLCRYRHRSMSSATSPSTRTPRTCSSNSCSPPPATNTRH